MPQRGELARAQRQPQGTLRAQGLGAAKDDDVPRTAGQHGLQVLLYPTPRTAPFGTSKVSCTEKLQNELAYVGEMQLKNSDESLLSRQAACWGQGGRGKNIQDLTLLHAF